ncbi:MAG: serine protease [Planctomycetales bacterium]|nr:serine protease [Planctomycetales bacterium]
MQNKFARLPSRLLCSLTALAIGLCAAHCTAEEAEVGGIFAKANDYAQARCVKIFGASIGRVEGYGTGLIVSDQGHILTAGGVMLSGERTYVVLPDGSRHLAKVERRSQNLQAALLKIDAATPDYFDLSKSPEAHQGDWALAVSNLFKVADGRERLSVNLGVISLRTAMNAKRGTQDIPYEGDVYLIDAITSNPGAAGGAVVDLDGRLVGMIGRIVESTDTRTRLNYAVPADLLYKFYMGQPLTAEVVAGPPAAGPPYLGIRVFSLGVGSKALAYVDRVLPNSPAAAAGLRSDDLIVAIGSQTVHDIREYKKIAATLTPGEGIVLLIKRKNDLIEVPITPTVQKEE